MTGVLTRHLSSDEPRVMIVDGSKVARRRSCFDGRGGLSPLVVRAVREGASCRAAAARFGVSASSAIGWCTRLRETGSVLPRALGGDRRSRRIEAHAPRGIANQPPRQRECDDRDEREQEDRAGNRCK